MALAILQFQAFENADAKFNIDTGTNRYYKLKIGRSVQRKYGIDWVDEVYFTSPLSVNDAGGNLLSSSKDIRIPLRHFDRGNAYIQLFSFKTPNGKSPAFSCVLRLPIGFDGLDGGGIELKPSLSIAASMKATDLFQPPRIIPCSMYREAYAQQASLEDLLAGIVKVAAPVVLDLLGKVEKDAHQNATSAPAGSNESAGLANLLAQLLSKVLGAVPEKAGPVASKQQSLNERALHANRFLDDNPQLSRPFFWQAILQAVAGPLVQMLPQLVNAANQKRIQLKQADNKLVTDILGNVNQRMLLEQLLQAQRQALSGSQPGNAGDLTQLIQLLQQMPAAPQQAGPGAAPQPVVKASMSQSLFLDAEHSFSLSRDAVVSFVTADPIPWNGMRKVLFAKNQSLQLKIQLNIHEKASRAPLPKVIVRFVFKDGSNQAILYEKTFKQKDVLSNRPMVFPFVMDDLSHLPVNEPIVLLVEMRWLNPRTAREYRAIGSSEIVLVNKYFLKEQENKVSAEQELTDMKRFRPFWNKIWEAKSLDSSGSKPDTDKKYLWELDVYAKYSVLLSAKHEANGLMETKIMRQQADEQSLSERTVGRMKAGIELSIAELNKLIPLWYGESALDYDKLEAFNTTIFAKNNTGEFIHNLKLKGRASERGMIWVVPIFKLFEFTLNTIRKTDDSGQVVDVTEEKVRFPLPVSARVIGLKSQ